jgi:outer membrane cobalamin receptor
MATPALAQSVDTVRTTLPEVVVEAESIVARAASATQPTSILGRDAIEASHARDASDVVAMAPGAFIRQYGGAGGLRTLSLRGTSSQQSVVLIDGIRYQSTAVGSVDLGSIPSAALRRVEVVRGGDAARHGAGALGGAVNLVTEPAFDGPASIGVRGDVGSFGEVSTTLSGASGTHTSALNGSITITRADGDYPFRYTEYGEQATVRRENSDLASLSARAGWSQQLGDVRLGLSAIGFSTERGVPGAIVQGHREQLNARMTERELFTTLRTSISESEWQGMLAASGRVNRLHYRDPDARQAGGDGIDSRYDRVETALIARARRAIGATALIEATGELAYARLAGTNLDPAVAGSVERWQWGASTSASWSIEGIVGETDVTLDAALRADGFSDVPAAASPSLGIVVRPEGGALRLRAHAALNYRVPSFLEEYYLNVGNTDLRPERSRSIDAGATYEVTPSFVVEAGAFVIDTRDQIISVPKSPLVWSAQNVARTLSRGVELSATGTLLEGMLALNLAYTRMRAEDRTAGPGYGTLLVYSPEELIHALVEARPGVFMLGVTWQYASHRHTLPTNAPEAALSRFGVVGAHAGARGKVAGLRIEARMEALNLLDAQYQVVRNYPMPGRAFRLGIEVAYAAR